MFSLEEASHVWLRGEGCMNTHKTQALGLYNLCHTSPELCTQTQNGGGGGEVRGGGREGEREDIKMRGRQDESTRCSLHSPVQEPDSEVTRLTQSHSWTPALSSPVKSLHLQSTCCFLLLHFLLLLFLLLLFLLCYFLLLLFLILHFLLLFLILFLLFYFLLLFLLLNLLLLFLFLFLFLNLLLLLFLLLLLLSLLLTLFLFLFLNLLLLLLLFLLFLSSFPCSFPPPLPSFFYPARSTFSCSVLGI